MVKLVKSEILQRVIRRDDCAELGVSTVTKAIEAIDKGRLTEAKDLVNYLSVEWKGLHDLYGDWSWGVYDYIAENFGEEELFKALKKAHAAQIQQIVMARKLISTEEYVHLLAEFMRAHRSGPKQLGDVVVKDEGDKYVIVSDPCGSGGMMRRGDPLTGTPPHTLPPYSHASVKGAYPWTWSKPNVARYCVHCAVAEIMYIEEAGYPLCIIEYPDDPKDPCKMLIYKDPKSIPESYYKRVGKSKTIKQILR